MELESLRLQVIQETLAEIALLPQTTRTRRQQVSCVWQEAEEAVRVALQQRPQSAEGEAELLGQVLLEPEQPLLPAVCRRSGQFSMQ